MFNVLNIFNDRIENKYSMIHILNTFIAFVEAIIPQTPELAEEYDKIQYYGAIDSLTYEYLILSLYELGGISLLKSTVEILDMAASDLVFLESNELSLYSIKSATFSALTPKDRLSALNVLRQQEISSYHNPMSTDEHIVDLLIKITTMGYYSEWFGYGLTRLNEPDQRVMEFKPISWKQVKYPGPATINFGGVNEQ